MDKEKREIRLQSNAKINIGLLIKGRREDGYHLLETLFYPIDLADELLIRGTNAPETEVLMEGLNVSGDPENNLCMRAYRLMKSRYPEIGPVRITVRKKIPAGGGLGGGSSNAAFTLKGLNQLFSLDLSPDELSQMAATLGADVPFFIHNRPLIAKGIGQDFEEIDFELNHELRLVFPGLHSSTPEVFAALDLSACDPSRNLLTLIEGPVADWKGKLVNDLETAAIRLHPALAGVKEKLYADGAVYASMTGSGSVFYGLFER